MALFITFEGPEGSGKTTQIRLLADALAGRRVPVVTTREPGGTRIGDGVRALLLAPAHREMSERAEALLFNAARAQLVDEVIRPALAAGNVVLCDRYADSTLAYQGYGHGQALDALRGLIRFATGGLEPDLTVYLDIEARLGLERKQPGEWNRMEAHGPAFHEAVRAGYLALAAAAPERWLVVAAGRPQEAIGQVIFARVAALLAATDHGPQGGD